MAVDERFEAPGPGMWNLDRSHFPGGTTPISEWLMEGCAKGRRRAFEEIGMPAETLDVRFVRGFMYSRLRPLISPDRAATKLPPLWCSSSRCGSIPRCGAGRNRPRTP